MLKVHISTDYRWCLSGKLPCYSVAGALFLIRRADVRTILAPVVPSTVEPHKPMMNDVQPASSCARAATRSERGRRADRGLGLSNRQRRRPFARGRGSVRPGPASLDWRTPRGRPRARLGCPAAKRVAPGMATGAAPPPAVNKRCASSTRGCSTTFRLSSKPRIVQPLRRTVDSANVLHFPRLNVALAPIRLPAQFPGLARAAAPHALQTARDCEGPAPPTHGNPGYGSAGTGRRSCVKGRRRFPRVTSLNMESGWRSPGPAQATPILELTSRTLLGLASFAAGWQFTSNQAITVIA
jgi:hypothetical protein